MLGASIDIGSNSILLLIADFDKKKFHYDEKENLAQITGLGRGVGLSQLFCQEAMDETFCALREYKTLIDKYNIEKENIVITATEASRIAKNAQSFFLKIKKELNLDIKIISGIEEAYYTALGICLGITGPTRREQLTIMDIGGASTELIRVDTAPFKICSSISLPMGAVRGSEWERDGSFDQKVKNLLAKNSLTAYKTDRLICSAGTMTSLGAMMIGLSTEYSDQKVNGITRAFLEFAAFIETIKTQSPEQLNHQYPFLGKRSTTIVAGAKIALKIGKILSTSQFEITTLGLRYGTLFENMNVDRVVNHQ